MQQHKSFKLNSKLNVLISISDISKKISDHCSFPTRLNALHTNVLLNVLARQKLLAVNFCRAVKFAKRIEIFEILKFLETIKTGVK